MDHAVILAGKSGLNREIRRVGTIEKPFVDHPEYCNRVAKPGDVYISKLFVYKSNPSLLYSELQFYHEAGSSGLITNKEMAGLFDDHALALADRYHIPILLVEDDTDLNNVMFEIMNLVITDRTLKSLGIQIEALLRGAPDPSRMDDLLREMKLTLKEHTQILYVRAEETLSPLLFQAEWGNHFLPAFQGLLFIISESDQNAIARRVSALTNKLRKTSMTYAVGLSSYSKGSDHLREAIIEALHAYSYASHTGKQRFCYEELDSYSLIAQISDHAYFHRYMDRFHRQLQNFDPDDHFDILNMMEVFILAEGNKKKAASDLFIHEGTLRYRLNRLKDHLRIPSDRDFYAEIKMLVYGEWVLQDDILAKIKAD